jgi:site-specific DNA recombinase
MKRTALYCRSALSDENSIELQKRKLISFAESVGYGEYALYSDNGASGNTLDRPAMNNLNSDIQDGKVKTVIAVDAARVCRNLVSFHKWLGFLAENGVGFISLEDEILF